MNPQQFNEGESKRLNTCGFSRYGYTFKGWATSASGSVKYNDKEIFYPGEPGVITLYAVWEANKYTVVFNANRGTGSMEPQEFTYDVEQVLSPNAFTREGYDFSHWNTLPNDNGQRYNPGERVKNITDKGGISIYAIWTRGSYTIHFDGNGATSGEMSDITREIGSKAERVPANKFKKEGYTFIGWNSQKDGSGIKISPVGMMGTYTQTKGDTVTFYA